MLNQQRHNPDSAQLIAHCQPWAIHNSREQQAISILQSCGLCAATRVQHGCSSEGGFPLLQQLNAARSAADCRLHSSCHGRLLLLQLRSHCCICCRCQRALSSSPSGAHEGRACLPSRQCAAAAVGLGIGRQAAAAALVEAGQATAGLLHGHEPRGCDSGGRCVLLHWARPGLLARVGVVVVGLLRETVVELQPALWQLLPHTRPAQ